MPLEHTKTCHAHGLAEILSSVSHENLRHDHLSCGCTVESECINAGDLVSYNAKIFRVDFVTREGIASIKNCDESHFVSSDTLKFIGKDTISKMVRDRIPLKVEIGDFVCNSTIDGDLLGKVIAVYGGSVRCRFLDIVDSEIKTDLWRIADVENAPSSFLKEYCNCGDVPHNSDCPLVITESSYTSSVSSDLMLSSDYRRSSHSSYYSRSSSSYGGEYPSYIPKIARPLAPAKTEKPKSDGYGISTADLIKEEVRTLAAQKSSEATVPSDKPAKRELRDVVDSLEPVTVTKRKNSW